MVIEIVIGVGDQRLKIILTHDAGDKRPHYSCCEFGKSEARQGPEVAVRQLWPSLWYIKASIRCESSQQHALKIKDGRMAAGRDVALLIRIFRHGRSLYAATPGETMR